MEINKSSLAYLAMECWLIGLQYAREIIDKELIDNLTLLSFRGSKL